VKLEAYPLVGDVVFFFQPIDNPLADIAEGSDIVGKYFEVDHDFVSPGFLPSPSLPEGHRGPQGRGNLMQLDCHDAQGASRNDKYNLQMSYVEQQQNRNGM
jgi:hypothetical protein